MSDLYGGMNTNYNMNNNNNKMGEDQKKKLLIIGGGAIVGIIIIMMIVVGIISSINNQKNNLYIDGVATKLNSTIFYLDSNNVPYVCVEKMAPKLGYEFFNGEYNTGSEDKTYCYVKNSNELATLQMDSNVVYKSLIDDTNFDAYKMSYKTIRVNDMLYISLPTMQKVFNVKYRYETDKNSLIISTLPALYQKYNTQVKNANYYEASSDFSNQKALLEDMIVVATKDRQMGVVSTNDMSTIIGTKYPNLTYCEGMGEFIAEQNGMYGVLVVSAQKEATVKVGFQYSSLKLIDNSIGLYLVGDSNKYGVLNRDGKILINLEYDKIGIENPKLFPTDNIKNSYVLYDYCIPVKQGEYWSMFNVEGKKFKNQDIYCFGSVYSTSQTSQNVLLIPQSEGMEGIVAGKKDYANKIKYGVLDINGNWVIPNSFSSIFKTVSGGETKYNMLFGNNIMSVSDSLRDKASKGSDSGTIQID